MNPYLIFGALLIIFMATYFGGVRKFYDKYAWWDRLIHVLLGILFVSFGVSISSKVVILNKLNIIFFSFTLSLAMQVILEIAEYTADCIKHSNHQRWQKKHNSINHKSPKLAQPAGLVDTMNDTIMCVIGAIIACLIWWIIL